MPSENEWVKAAYYDPATENYSLYATQSNTAPTIASASASGDVSNPGSNVANYASGAAWNSVTGNVTTVGSAGATSFYGTYDQAGNVWEWNEEFVTGSSRGLRGGSWNNFELHLRASNRNIRDAPTSEFDLVGFRVASVPEPSSALLVLFGGAAWLLKRRRKLTR